MSSTPRRLASRILMDVTPVRVSRDFRALLGGQLVSILGIQLTAVAVPYQVYAMTRSLLVGSLVDSLDRRGLLMAVEVANAVMTAGLALDADLLHTLWPMFVFPA